MAVTTTRVILTVNVPEEDTQAIFSFDSTIQAGDFLNENKEKYSPINLVVNTTTNFNKKETEDFLESLNKYNEWSKKQ